ncbi:MAG: DegT/DnrJ/EryC1/StrS family aminotransferase [Candidatus Omnitrophica bacterium]|nr:DegT/DnrJ/EryC1/StrS family aminotransferase [Candidatus Omnitrophota bacterium]
MSAPAVSTRVPYIDLAAEYRAIKDEVNPVVLQVLASGAYTLGPHVEALEREAADRCGRRHVVTVGSGTDALEFALRASGIGPGDEVLAPAMTFVATIEAIASVGARPVIVDIDPATYLMDPAQAAGATTSKTRGIIPVHLYGHPCAMDALTALAQRRQLVMIEDCAQAIEATWRGQRVGTFGTAGAFSFFPTKNLGACGDGGMVITDEVALAERVRMLRVHGSLVRDDHRLVGRTGRLDELQAAILRVKFRHLAAWTEARRAWAQQYTRLIRERLLPVAPEIAPPTEADGARHVYHIYALRVPRRDALLKFLQQQGVGALVHYSRPVHLQPAFAQFGFREGMCPVGEALARDVISLPLYPTMGAGAVEQVVEALVQFYRGSR